LREKSSFSNIEKDHNRVSPKRNILSSTDELDDIVGLQAENYQNEISKPEIDALCSDWIHIQTVLRLLQVISCVMQRFETFCGTLNLMFKNLSNKLFVSSIDDIQEANVYFARIYLSKDLCKATKLRNILFSENVAVERKISDTPCSLIQMKGAEKNLSFCKASAQKLVYDFLMEPIRLSLSSVPSMDLWALEPHVEDFELPTYSSPSQYCTKVGEYLLAIVQQLEPFALPLENINFDSHSSTSKGCNEESDVIRILSFGEQEWSILSAFIETSTVSHAKSILRESADFTTTWCASIAHGTVGIFLKSVFTIKHLTDVSSVQLSTDIEYLENVITALGIEIVSALTSLKDFLSMARQELSDFIGKHRTEKKPNEAVDSVKLNIAKAIAKIRGVPLTF
jgi:hypothetical protein